MTDRCKLFLDSLGEASPPPDAPDLLRAVWHGLRGEWRAAHDIVEDDHTSDGAWVHAWLHRIEGDLGNAAYWYHRAGKTRPPESIVHEGELIAKNLLSN